MYQRGLSVLSCEQITIHKSRFQMPSPFSVIATQNPIESEGVYPLPEAAAPAAAGTVVVAKPAVVAAPVAAAKKP